MAALARCAIASATALGGPLRYAEHRRLVSSEKSLDCQSAGAVGKAASMAASAFAASSVGDSRARGGAAPKAKTIGTRTMAATAIDKSAAGAGGMLCLRVSV